MTLYEINKSIEEVLNRVFESVDSETGELNESGMAAMKELEQLQEAREEKLDNIGAFIKNLEAEEQAIREEAKKLLERADAKKKKKERLKNYVASDLLGHDETKFESTRVAFSFRKSVSVKIDESKLPKKYFVKKTEMKPDKVAIKEAITAGLTVRGAVLEEKQNLQVK